MSASGVIGAGSLLVVVALGAFATVRDKMLDVGLNRPRWLVRSSHRAAARRVSRDVAQLGSLYFERSGNIVDVTVASKKLQAETRKRPDLKLIGALKPWIVQLGQNTDFHGNKFYANTMGAVSASEDFEALFAAISHGWITALQLRQILLPFDCIVGLKDGNPILTHAVSRRLGRTEDSPVRAVFCKGAADSARVANGPHETDFEGLRAFRDHGAPARSSDGRFRAIAFDDNCTSGRSLLDGISRFNDFVAAHQNEYPFAPIDTAVVLFVVKSDRDFAFDDEPDIRIHALLALGDDELEKIKDERNGRLVRMSDAFKTSSACEVSRVLEATEPRT